VEAILMDDNKVAILLEDLQAQFRTFGEGLQLLNDKVDKVDQKVNKIQVELTNFKDENHQEHKLLKQMMTDLNSDVKRLDTEVVQIKRVK
jgi:hypothetical protein